MSIVVDPDDLDRWQCCFDPTNELLHLKGFGADRVSKKTDGAPASASTTFTSATGLFQTNSVAQGDILTIATGEDGVIGHWVVDTITNETTLDVTTAFPTNSDSGCTYKISVPTPAAGPQGGTVGDGVVGQVLYSFCKEEYRTLSDADMDDLIRVLFPWEPLTSESYELGGTAHGDWDFGNDASRYLVRRCGWQKLDANGNVKQDWPGMISLGLLDSDTQTTFQQHSADNDPENFQLTGAVDQAVNSFDEVTGPDAGTGFAITLNNTIARNDGGNWYTDGYRAGGKITIRAAEDSGNNGTWDILSVEDATDGDLVVVGSGLTNNAADTTMIAAVNKRFYFKMRARKKGKTYPEVDIAFIGVTELKPIVNRFPLAHDNDPAILLDDGSLEGDGTNNVFQGTEQHSSGSNGATVDNEDGTFDFSSASVSPAFNTVLVPGDVVNITSGSYQGAYEIKSITDADTVVCYHEPTNTYPGDETSLTFTVRTAVRDSGLANATLTDVDGDTGTLDSSGASFTTDDGLGSRTVVAGDMVIITAGDNAVLGAYKVVSITDADTLVLNTSDQVFGGETNQTYHILQAGMHLQYFSEDATEVVAAGGRTLEFKADETITASSGSFITDGYKVGMAITVTGTTNNNGTYIIKTVTALIITVIDEESLTAEGPLSSGATLNATGGIYRTMNAVTYPFNWRLFANGGSLGECFQYIQKELRRATDIDEGSGAARGDITDLLMAYTSPNGIPTNLYLDDQLSTELNNTTKVDLSGDSRNFAFIAGLTITLNANILADASAKVTVFFDDPDGTPASGDEFPGVGAIIVEDKDAVDMEDTTPLSSPLSFSFDYTNNAQGGRTPDTDAPIHIVCVGTDKAVYAHEVGTILKQNNNPFALSSALERTFTNPT